MGCMGSVFNIERERSISELMVRYEAEKKGREIEQGKLLGSVSEENIRRYIEHQSKSY